MKRVVVRGWKRYGNKPQNAPSVSCCYPHCRLQHKKEERVGSVETDEEGRLFAEQKKSLWVCFLSLTPLEKRRPMKESIAQHVESG